MTDAELDRMTAGWRFRRAMTDAELERQVAEHQRCLARVAALGEWDTAAILGANVAWGVLVLATLTGSWALCWTAACTTVAALGLSHLFRWRKHRWLACGQALSVAVRAALEDRRP